MIKPFERKSSRTVLETRVFKVREDHAIHPVTGHAGNYVVLEQPDFVNIVALTPEGQLILVKQWRHGTRTIELEIPAGLVEAGEAPEVAGPRELVEETGYIPAKTSILGHVAPNAAYQQNRCTTLLCEGCTPTGKTHFDEGEDLEVVLASPSEVRGWLMDGTIRNALVFTGLMWWLEKAGRVSWP